MSSCELVHLNCMWCESFQVVEGEPDYSEYTPGCDWKMSCAKKHWEIDGLEITLGEYRENMLKALSCHEFKLSDDAKKMLEQKGLS